MIKPIAEGSSVGVFIVPEDHVHPPQELTREDWAYGERVIVESYIAGKELTCAVMGDAALGVIEIVPMVRFYDYEAKYAPGALNTCFRLRFHRLFTKRSEDYRWRRIARSAAGA